MRPTVAKLRRGMAVFLILWGAFAAAAEPIPRPEALKDDVDFWIRVYTEVTTNEGLLHDERNLAVVYDTLKFSTRSSPRERQRLVDDRRDEIIAALKRII